ESSVRLLSARNFCVTDCSLGMYKSIVQGSSTMSKMPLKASLTQRSRWGSCWCRGDRVSGRRLLKTLFRRSASFGWIRPCATSSGGELGGGFLERGALLTCDIFVQLPFSCLPLA